MSGFTYGESTGATLGESTGGTLGVGLSAPTNLSVDSTGETSVDLSWTDNATGEDEYRLEHRKELDAGFGDWTTVKTLAADTTSATDDTVQPERTYEFRVRVVKGGLEKTSNVVSTTTTSADVRQDRVPSAGWYAEIDHSDGTTVRPRLLDDPQIRQQVNGLPQLTIPVPFDERWQASGFEDATVRVYRDGQPQPVDTLVDVELQEGDREKRTVLTLEGGTQLKRRATASYQFKDAHTAADELITSTTSYTANVDDPVTNTTEVLMQDVDSDSEWESNLSAHPFPSDDPRHITNGELRTHPSAQFLRAESANTDDWEQFFGDRFENGEARREFGINNSLAWQVPTDYTIPSGDITIWFRFQYFDDTHPGFSVDFGGDEVLSVTADNDFMGADEGPRWVDATGTPNSDFSSTTTLQIDIDTAATDDSYLYVDCAAVVDDRHTDAQTDDTLTSGGRLSWPHLHPSAIQSQTTDAAAINQVTGGRLESTWNNTANNQALALSNDQGSSWEITGSNTESIDGSFSSSSGQIRARLTQSYYDSGAGPVEFDVGQTVDLYELYADQEDTPTLVDRAFDDQLVNVLTTIAEDKDFVYEVRVDRDYTFSVEWAQPGQRTSDDNADIASYTIAKNTGDVIEKAVIKGGRQTQRAESFTSNHDTWVDLGQDDLIEGNEAVYNGQQFDRGDDYEMDYLDGRIKVLSSGSMADSTSFNIDYEYKPQGSYTKTGVSNPKTVVRSVPAIHSESTAEQLAFTLVTKFSDPIYEATVTVPRQPAGWSVIDEITPDRIPRAGEALQIRDVTTTPESVVHELATQEGLDAFLQRVQQRLAATETRV